jgi:hypothetical protein
MNTEEVFKPTVKTTGFKILDDFGRAGLVCVVLRHALWAHVGDFGVALCGCTLNLVIFLFLSPIIPAYGKKTSIFLSIFFKYLL